MALTLRVRECCPLDGIRGTRAEDGDEFAGVRLGVAFTEIAETDVVDCAESTPIAPPGLPRGGDAFGVAIVLGAALVTRTVSSVDTNVEEPYVSCALKEKKWAASGCNRQNKNKKTLWIL